MKFVFGFMIVLSAVGCDAKTEGQTQKAKSEVPKKISDVKIAETPGLPTPAAGTHVVISTKTRLYTAPKDDAKIKKSIVSAEKFVVYEILKRTGDFVKLGFAHQLKHQQLCYATHSIGAQLDIELWAKASSLEKVISRETVTTFDDGTKSEFAAGVVIRTSKNGSVTAGLGYNVPAPDTTTTSFKPASFSRPAKKTKLAYAVTPLVFGGGNVTSSDGYRVSKMNDSSEDVELAFRCGRVVGRLTETEKPRGTGLGQHKMLLGVLSGTAATHEVRANAKLSWPDGQSAGKVRSTIRVDAKLAKDGKQCFELGGDDEHVLFVCAKDEDVKKLPNQGLFGELGAFSDVGDFGGVGSFGLGNVDGDGLKSLVKTTVTVKGLKRCENKICKTASKSDVQAFGLRFNKNKKRFGYCYESTKRKNKNTKNSAEIGFSSTDKGRVKLTDKNRTVDALHTCLQRSIIRMRVKSEPGVQHKGRLTFTFKKRR